MRGMEHILSSIDCDLPKTDVFVNSGRDWHSPDLVMTWSTLYPSGCVTCSKPTCMLFVVETGRV